MSCSHMRWADWCQFTTLILQCTYRLDLPQVDLTNFQTSDEVVRGLRRRTFLKVYLKVPCEQRFLSRMALSVSGVAGSRGLSVVWLVSLRPVRRKQTNYATDKPRERLCKR